MTSRTPTPRIAVVGSYGTGLTMRLERAPGPGETVIGHQFSTGPGGKGSNQAIGAARLGAQVSLLTAVGDDEFAASARRLWRAEGIDAGGVVTVDAPTMAGVILVERSGENRIAIAPGALDLLTPEHVERFEPAIAAADLLMVCNEIPVETVLAALRVARRNGVTTLLNPAPARAMPESVWPLVDYLTPNVPEALMLAGAGGDSVDSGSDSRGNGSSGSGSSGHEVSDMTAATTALAALRETFKGTIVLTAGAAGALVDDPRAEPTAECVHIAAVPARHTVDTTGAGDAFNAAFAVAVASGTGAVAAARRAVAAGSFAVGRAEVIPGLPTTTELEAVLRGGAANGPASKKPTATEEKASHP